MRARHTYLNQVPLSFSAQEEKKTHETSRAGAIPKQDFLKVLRKKKAKGEIGMEYRVSMSTNINLTHLLSIGRWANLDAVAV